MSDKLFKNDLTPSACQSDGNFGQSAWPLLLSLLPPPQPPFYPVSLSWRRPSSKRESSRHGCGSLIIPRCLGHMQSHPSLEKPGGRGPVCRPGWEAPLPPDQLPSSNWLAPGQRACLSLAGLPGVLTPLCGAGLASDSQVSSPLNNPRIS